MTGTETPRERLEQTKENWFTPRRRLDEFPALSADDVRDFFWLLRVCEAAVEAYESGALRYPTFAMKGHRALVAAIEDHA